MLKSLTVPMRVAARSGCSLMKLTPSSQPCAKFQHDTGIGGGEFIADHEDVGDQVIGDAGVVDFARAGALGDGVGHVGIPGDGGVHLLLREESGGLDAVFGVDGLGEDLIALLGGQAGAFQAVPEEEVRGREGREGDGLAGEVFDALDALRADDAIGAARPIDHVEGVGVEALVLEFAEILAPDVGRW
jgi:hypothetical protein